MAENPPAFPSGDKANFPTSTFEAGMSLRDYFAGQALAGFAANIEYMQAARALCAEDGKPTAVGEYLAASAYNYADALLAQREKGEQS